MKKQPFYVGRVSGDADLSWGVFERPFSKRGETKLTSRWQFREQAREAAHALNKEEPTEEELEEEMHL